MKTKYIVPTTEVVKVTTGVILNVSGLGLKDGGQAPYHDPIVVPQ